MKGRGEGRQREGGGAEVIVGYDAEREKEERRGGMRGKRYLFPSRAFLPGEAM